MREILHFHQNKTKLRNESTGKCDSQVGCPDQCFRQTVPLRESRVAIKEGPQKNRKMANLPLYFYKAAGLTPA